jgi:lysophospholipase L1-like esterase
MRALPLLALLAACARISDVDGDGRLTLFAFGDSNTNWLPRAWPEVLRDRHGLAVVNAGVLGLHATTALRDDMLRPRLVDEHPDVVVIALGTNDVADEVPPEVVAETVLFLADQASRHCYGRGRCIKAFVATVPPIYAPPRDRGFDSEIQAINATLRARVDAARLVDFDSWMPAQFDPALMIDGIHLGRKLQARRADEVARLLWWPWQ